MLATSFLLSEIHGSSSLIFYYHYQFIMCLYSTCYTLIIIVVTDDSTLGSSGVDSQPTWYLAIDKY